MYKAILVILVSITLLGLVPGATAQERDNVGLSGQCYNGDASKGGEDEARVYADGEVVLLPGTVDRTDPGDPENGGAAPALALFATESAMEGGNTGNACKRYDCKPDTACNPGESERYDYLEVGVRSGSVSVQACYDGGAATHGNCPRSPTGAGN